MQRRQQAQAPQADKHQLWSAVTGHGPKDDSLLMGMQSLAPEEDADPDDLLRYQEMLRQAQVQKRMKEASKNFRETLLATRDRDELDNPYLLFSFQAPQLSPGRDYRGKPILSRTLDEVGKGRFLEKARRWDEAHNPPSVLNSSVRHIMRVDDRVAADRGNRDYPTRKPKAKAKGFKKTGSAHFQQQMKDKQRRSSESQEDSLELAIKKWDNYIIDQLDRGKGLELCPYVEREETKYVEQEQYDSFTSSRRSTVRKSTSMSNLGGR